MSMESVGISDKDNDDLSSYDEIMVQKFKEDIEFRDRNYYVKLPWNDN